LIWKFVSALIDDCENEKAALIAEMKALECFNKSSFKDESNNEEVPRFSAIVPVLQTGNDGNKNDDVIGDTFFTNLANGLYAEAAHQDDINDQHAKLTSALDIDFPDLDIQIEIDLTNDLYNQRLLQEEEEIDFGDGGVMLSEPVPVMLVYRRCCSVLDHANKLWFSKLFFCV